MMTSRMPCQKILWQGKCVCWFCCSRICDSTKSCGLLYLGTPGSKRICHTSHRMFHNFFQFISTLCNLVGYHSNRNFRQIRMCHAVYCNLLIFVYFRNFVFRKFIMIYSGTSLNKPVIISHKSWIQVKCSSDSISFH